MTPEEAWVMAGLAVQVTEPSSEQHLAVSRPWLFAVLDEVHLLPPLGVVMDAGRVLLGDGIQIETPTFEQAELNRAVRNYQEHVVGRLRNDPRRVAAADAMARLSSGKQAAAIAVLLRQMFDRIRPQLRTRSPGPVRRALQRSAEQLVHGVEQALKYQEAAIQVARDLEALSVAARRAGVLLTDSDVFVLENLEVLRNAAERLAFSQILEVSEWLERSLPRHIRTRQKKTGRIATQLDDESIYPTGGYASIATHGSIENLVTSELVYLEGGPHVDLFDVRYAANELLKFTRDETVFCRASRKFVFLFKPDLVRIRFKDADVDWQRLVLVLGWVVAAVRRLITWLKDADLCVELRLGPELRAEEALLGMAFREWVEQGVVTMQDPTRLDVAETKWHRVDVVTLSATAERSPPLDGGGIWHLCVGEDEVYFLDSPTSSGSGMYGWSVLLSNFLKQVV